MTSGGARVAWSVVYRLPCPAFTFASVSYSISGMGISFRAPPPVVGRSSHRQALIPPPRFALFRFISLFSLGQVFFPVMNACVSCVISLPDGGTYRTPLGLTSLSRYCGARHTLGRYIRSFVIYTSSALFGLFSSQHYHDRGSFLRSLFSAGCRL